MKYSKSDIYTDAFIDIIKRYITSKIIETFEYNKFPYIQICLGFYGVYKKPSIAGFDVECIPFYKTINCFSEELIKTIEETAYQVQAYLISKLDDTFEDTFEISHFKEYSGDIVKYFTYQDICPNYKDFPFMIKNE